jgi:hypothetical protein
LRTLANAHEWGFAYNASSDTRAIAGKVLAGQILQFLNSTLTSTSPNKIAIQFGAYGTFFSFFGLADLPSVSDDFRGIVDYASSMAFELFTNSSSDGSSPTPENSYVRFVFHNGTASTQSPPSVYPLFGSGMDVLSWKDFVAGMQKFSVGSTEQWCTACGNFTGICAAYDPSGSESSTAGNGLSPAINGLIGAIVTLAVVLVGTVGLLVSGFRVVRMKNSRAESGKVNGKEAS